MENVEVGDDSSSSSTSTEEFDFIESTWENMVEIGLIIRWPTASRPLHLSTKLEENELAPLFNGTQWAGTRVWKAAVLAVEYLVEHHFQTNKNANTTSEEYQPSPPSLLELGCGLGVPGMLWHMLHDDQSKVVLTDRPALLSQLQQNVVQNFPSSHANEIIQAKPLSWSEEGLADLLDHCGPFDICLNCDCIYEPLYGRDSWEALADVLGSLAKKSPKTLLVTSVERRNGDGLDDFFKRLLATGSVAPIDQVLRNEDDKHHVIEIYITRGKAIEE
eukprot:scaffold437_cov111-Cylindrotheca_fusiformis.AAC.8